MAPDANRTNRVEDNPDHYYAGSGIGLIIAERRRQVAVEGYDSTHDDTHTAGDLAEAAATYALPAPFRFKYSGQKMVPGTSIPGMWPWPDGWKPTPNDRIRELAKAGALIAAEIDRILRAKNKPK
jgi:hypothetical protein